MTNNSKNSNRSSLGHFFCFPGNQCISSFCKLKRNSNSSFFREKDYLEENSFSDESTSYIETKKKTIKVSRHRRTRRNSRSRNYEEKEQEESIDCEIEKNQVKNNVKLKNKQRRSTTPSPLFFEPRCETFTDHENLVTANREIDKTTNSPTTPVKKKSFDIKKSSSNWSLESFYDN